MKPLVLAEAVVGGAVEVVVEVAMEDIQGIQGAQDHYTGRGMVDLGMANVHFVERGWDDDGDGG